MTLDLLMYIGPQGIVQLWTTYTTGVHGSPSGKAKEGGKVQSGKHPFLYIAGWAENECEPQSVKQEILLLPIYQSVREVSSSRAA